MACSKRMGAAAVGAGAGAVASVAALLLLALMPPPAAAASVTVTPSWCKTDIGNIRVVDSGRDDLAHTLFLNNCNISTLPLDTFTATELPNLKRVLIMGNDIERIDAALFLSVSYLKYISLENNKLRKVPIFGKHSLFPLLKYLDLHGNRITAITDEKTFSACAVLEALDLHDNRIEYLHPKAFKGTNLKAIFLGGNKIKFVSETLFQIKSLENIDLDSNLIEYVAPGAFRGTNLTELNLIKNRISFLPARLVSELKILTHFTFYENPWHCACLLELLADAKKAGVSYDRWMFSSPVGAGTAESQWEPRWEPQCVFAGRQRCRRRAPADLLPPSGLPRPR